MGKLTEGYFGDQAGSAETSEFAVSLMTWEPNQVQPWHFHDTATLFLLFQGAHYDESGLGSMLQPHFSVLFRPALAPHRALVSPVGVAGLNISLSGNWLESMGKTQQDIGDYRLSKTPSLWFDALKLAVQVRFGMPSKQQIEMSVIETIEPLFGSTPEESSPGWLARAESFLRESYSQPVSLRDVALFVSIDPIHVARTFRAKHGCTVSEFIRRLRLAESARLLLEGSATAGVAAVESGFFDQAHLVNSMKSELQVTPKQVKRLFRQP